MNRGRYLAVVTGSLIALGALPVSGQAPAKSDPAKAQQIVNQICAACHGPDGNSVGSANPHLAGQHPDYLASQLTNFKSGLRKNPVMLGMSATLSPEDMKAVAQFYGEKKPKAGAAKDKALAEIGQKIYRGGNAKTGLPACSSCHGPTGAGMPAQYPRLAGQYSEYTYAQLQAFARGERGTEIKKDSKVVEDVQGKIMSAIAAKMTEQEMKAVAEYVLGLR